MLLVPFTSDYEQQLRTQLGDETFVIDARWNERTQYWTLDLTRDSDSTLLVAGVPLLIGQDVLAPYALGVGGMYFTDLSGGNSDAGPDDFGDRVAALYFTPAELDVLAANGVSGTSSGGPSVPAISPGLVPAPPPTPSGGGTSGGGSVVVNTIINQTINTTLNNLSLSGGGFGSDQFRDDSTGSEVLAYQFPVNASLNPNPTVKAIATIIAAGSGTIRLYVGGALQAIGDTGTPSGVLVGSIAGPGSAGSVFINGSSTANPGGLSYVKITIQSTAPLTDLQIDIVNGALG